MFKVIFLLCFFAAFAVNEARYTALVLLVRPVRAATTSDGYENRYSNDWSANTYSRQQYERYQNRAPGVMSSYKGYPSGLYGEYQYPNAPTTMTRFSRSNLPESEKSYAVSSPSESKPINEETRYGIASTTANDNIKVFIYSSKYP